MMKGNRLLFLVSALLFACFTSHTRASFSEVKFDVLQTRTGSYSNVTVTTCSKKSVFILHSTGMSTIPLTELSPEIHQMLGITDHSKDSKGPTQMQKFASAVNLSQATQYARSLDKNLRLNITPTFLAIMIAIILTCHLFASYCMKLISQKAGHAPGILIWVPALQLLPMLRAAKMSPLWFFGFFIPILNFIASVIWCFKISSARGKSPLIAFLLLLPVTNLVAFLYLAFSDSSANSPPPVKQTPSEGSPIVLQTA